MTKLASWKKLALAVMLALLGFVLSIGGASAHSASSDQVSVAKSASADSDLRRSHAGPSAAVSPMEAVLVGQCGKDCDGSCSDHQKSGHSKAGCCTVTCHAALPALVGDASGKPEFRDSRVASLTDVLIGRSSDRAERPPRSVD